MSRTYSFKTVQVLPVSKEVAWDFFSDPENLQAITPGKLRFRIISAHNANQMYAGQLIEYTIKPLWGIPLYWMTEITQLKQHVYFIDEQRYGPYSFWHHQHHFKEVPGGIEMTDIVHYKLPFWLLGGFAHRFFVKQELKNIFDYRSTKIEQHFQK